MGKWVHVMDDETVGYLVLTVFPSDGCVCEDTKDFYTDEEEALRGLERDINTHPRLEFLSCKVVPYERQE